MTSLSWPASTTKSVTPDASQHYSPGPRLMDTERCSRDGDDGCFGQECRCKGVCIERGGNVLGM